MASYFLKGSCGKIRQAGLIVTIQAAMFLLLQACSGNSHADDYSGWSVYGGTNDHIQYSSLFSIDTDNVRNLQVAWTFSTHDAEPSGQLQVNAIVRYGKLYGVSPRLKLFALDAATGTRLWLFNPFPDTGRAKNVNICRGMAFFDGGSMDRKIFYTVGAWLYCIDAATGKPVTTFGSSGKIDLHDNLGRDVASSFVTSTSPGIIYKDMVIMGIATSEDASAAPGHIRAYDVHTGKLRWIFHTIPYPGEAGYETWEDTAAYRHTGGANVWAGFSLDEKRGILFAPTGSATDDWYGGKRLGNNMHANCVIALDAATGRLKWSYQTVHHDVWDRDLPAAPVLVKVEKDGRQVEAVAQVTKTGFLFVLDRETGQPLFPVEERPVPVDNDLTGQVLAPTQPYPTFYKPFVRQTFTEQDLFRDIPDTSYLDIKTRLAGYRTGHLFYPPSKTPTMIFPGMTGGAEWGGPAYDPGTGILYINANEIPRVLTMVNAEEKAVRKGENLFDAGRGLFINHCSACHGADRKGNADFPSLLSMDKKMDEAALLELLASGRRRMPAFNYLGLNEKKAVAGFLLESAAAKKTVFQPTAAGKDEYHSIPYASSSNRPSKFETKEGYPAVSPPWGTLTAINLNTGAFEWKLPLGEYPELKARGIHSGTENFGGPVVTAGGLLFIAATRDEKFRAYNKRTGELLWETTLPAAGFATPSVYAVDGRQFIVIACGGGKLRTKSGDTYVAFSLPSR